MTEPQRWLIGTQRWSRLLVAQLWSGQYNMSMDDTWHYLPELGVNWAWLCDLCGRIGRDGMLTPVNVRTDETPMRLSQGHHRFWVACMLDLPALDVSEPRYRYTLEKRLT